MHSVIKLEKVTKIFQIPRKQSLLKSIFAPKYDPFTAVSNVTFSVQKGESVALLGPNGAGKTTTLKLLTGILYPTSGEIKLLGQNPVARNYEMLSRIGFVMGNKSTLNTDLSAMQNYELNRTIYRIEPNHFYRTIDQLGELLEVSNHLQKQIRKLSLGQRMKVELIGAILHQPEILFLDEPTIGLDISSQNNIRSFLKTVHKEYGTTIILTSHNMEDIEQVSQRVIVITEGKLVFDDSLEQLKRSFSAQKYIKVIFSSNVTGKMQKEYQKFGKVLSCKHDAIVLEVEKSSQAKIVAEIMADANVVDIDIEGVPLSRIIESVFHKK